MNAVLSPEFDGGPFDPDIGDLPTVMVPPRRPGVFAVIHVDGREVFLRVCRLQIDGSFLTLREEHAPFNAPDGSAADPRRVAVSLADLLSRFQRTAELMGATIRAVATQAFRAVPNHVHLLKRIPRVTRVALELISERDAARFVCLGALRGRRAGQRTVVIDAAPETTSIILANAEEPLALWRLAIGTAQLLPPGSVIDAGRTQAASWRRQIQQTLSLGHLDAIRGAATEAVLLRRPNPASPGAPGPGHAVAGLAHLLTSTLLDEIAAYLGVQRVGATDAGLPEGILVDLSRARGTGAFQAAGPRGNHTPPPRAS